MKNLPINIVVSFIIFSCQTASKKEQITEHPLANPTLKNSIWVNAKYLETLEKTKSPLQANEFADTVMVNFNAKADTANLVWNFHEGSEFSVKKGKKIQLFNVYDIKPMPEYEGVLNGNKLILSNTLFTQVDTVGFIEKKFWIGKYLMKNKKITLKFDGKITGIDSLSTYYVWSDYVTTQTNIDLIDFRTKNNKSNTYGYKFIGNEIVFYKFIWQEDGLIGKSGKEVFRWKKL
ncbi:MAG: hypothetical protein V4585_19810 [Bacteroidota bacterium]